MRNDSTTLKVLVEKYHKMHAEGPGRRLLWSLMESGNLTDLRRRIGYHEQTLQLWYMTLVYGSLRRLEGGQEDIIAAIKSIHREDLRKVSRSLRSGDSKPLKRELRQRGISVDNIEANMETAIDYITAPPIEKLRMETRLQSRSSAPVGHLHVDGSRDSSRNERPFDYGWPIDNESPVDYKSSRFPFSKGNSGRSNSTSAGPKYRHSEDSEAQVQPGKSSQKRTPRNVTVNTEYTERTEPRVHDRRASESLGSRAKPLLIVDDSNPLYQHQPPTSRHRSKSRREKDQSSSDIGRDREGQPSIIIVEHRGGRSKDRQEDTNKRDLSTNSYIRRSRRSSVESAGREEDKYTPRQVHVMNRIDSIPVDSE